MPSAFSIEQWPDRLERVIAEHCTLLRRAVVLRETDSTQDAARRMQAKPGDVVIAWRQTAGRGRLGRAWADTAEHGVALTIVVDRSVHASEALAIAAAVGAAHAAEMVLHRTVGIKWPNDILVDGRKLAGILIERFESLAMIGLGMNVGQVCWPDELSSRAISSVQLGVMSDRLDVITALLVSIDRALQFDGTCLAREFTARDVLRGQQATFRNGDRITHGTVAHIDPMRGLLVNTSDGDVWLDAATTTVTG